MADSDIPSSDVPTSDSPPTGGSETRSLSPDTYVYSTPKSPEHFGKVPYSPPLQPKNNLSPPSVVQPLTTTEVLCSDYPESTSCHEESNPYSQLGFFADENKDMFDPSKRNPDRKKVDKPINNIYENKSDDIQLDVPNVKTTTCKCKDGRVVQGYINMRNGQKDCSNCQKQRKSYPNAYKNYKTKPKAKKPRTDIHQPLRKQVGVSHFGDVNMRGCNVETKTSQPALAQNTLNKVVNLSNEPPKGMTITKPDTTRCVPNGYSLYDTCPTDIYGV